MSADSGRETYGRQTPEGQWVAGTTLQGEPPEEDCREGERARGNVASRVVTLCRAGVGAI